MPVSSQQSKYRLRVNAYDRVSSWLVSLLIISSFTVAGLLIVYFTRQFIVAAKAIPVTPVEVARQPADVTMGLKQDPEPPGVEVAPDLLEPQLEDTLNAVADAVASRAALLSDESIDATGDTAQGSGLGDSRRAGTGGKGESRREPVREIVFEPENLRQYAEFLDYFRIELGVLGKDNKIYYAYNLAKQEPDVRVGEPDKEDRLYMNSALGRFAALDRRLAKNAGIVDRGRIILQFYPPETQAILYDLERRQAAGHKPESIRRTIFRVTPKGKEFEFGVEQQLYR
jgi:hypothetical protein